MSELSISGFNFNKFKNDSYYQDYRVTITNTYTGNANSKELKGLLVAPELSFSPSADVGTEDTLIGKASEIIASHVSDLTRSMVKTKWGTIEGYNGAEFLPEFDISFIMFPEAGQSYHDIILNLTSYVLPITTLGIMRPPTYDVTTFANIITNVANGEGPYPFDGQLIHVVIGNWFHASGLHCTSVNHEFSKYMDEDGHPMYVNVTMSFKSYRALDAEEYAQWYLK